jgi:uncharacterized protein YeaO (DUF488 family)
MHSSSADHFFMSPSTEPAASDLHSVLYLLRRDIFTCFGMDPTTQSRIEHSTLWPGAMAILAGIDLLAKFLAGNDARGEVGKRFRDYIQRYLQPLNADDEEVVYQLRNALLHSFGLHSMGCAGPYDFVLLDRTPDLVLRYPKFPNVYGIGLRTLHERFEQSIGRYQEELRENHELQENFDRIHDQYGEIIVIKNQGDEQPPA